jgi:hypothetical protein
MQFGNTDTYYCCVRFVQNTERGKFLNNASVQHEEAIHLTCAALLLLWGVPIHTLYCRRRGETFCVPVPYEALTNQRLADKGTENTFMPKGSVLNTL